MLEAVCIDCPYCGESIETTIDCSAGGQSYIEDCAVCCQPIELSTRFDINGKLSAVQASRNDD